MTFSYSPAILGGAQPPAGEGVTLVTMGTNENAYVNIVIANNSHSSNEMFSVAIKLNTSTLGPSNYLAYLTSLPPGAQVILPNIGLSSNYQVIVMSVNGFASFNITGSQFFN